MPSLPAVSAKVIADAQQFINEFRRAEHAAHGHGEGIRHEVDHIIEHMSKSARGFSAMGFAHGLLASFGVGSGAMIVEHMIEQFRELWHESEEFAEKLEQRAENIAKIFEKIHAATFTEMAAKAVKSGDVEGAVEILMRQSREISAKMDEQVAKRDEALKGIGEAGKAPYGAGIYFDYDILGKPATGGMKKMGDEFGKVADEAQAKWAELLETFKANAAAIEKIEEAAKKAGETLAEKAFAAHQKGMTEALREQEKAFDELLKKTHEHNLEVEHANEVAERLAEKYRELADVTLRYKKEIAEVNKLMSDGKLAFDLGTIAIEKLRAAMLDAELKELFGDLDKMVPKIKEANDFALELGHTFANSFEEAIVSGRKLSDVLRSLAQDVLRLFVHQSITAPIAGYLGAAFSGVFSGGGTAATFGGGGASTGGGGGAGFSSSPASSGSSGGDNYFTYNFASGVTRQEVAGLLPQLVDASKRAVAEANMRGGAYRRAMA